MMFQMKGCKAVRGLAAVAGANLAVAFLSAGAAFAQAADFVIGAPRPNQMGLPYPVTPIAREMNFFHDAILLPIITVICLFVLALLVIVVSKFNEKANATPSRTTHHTGLEIAWTIIPVLILVVIAGPSVRLLNNQLTMPNADMTIKVTGNSSWAWTWTNSKAHTHSSATGGRVHPKRPNAT